MKNLDAPALDIIRSYYELFEPGHTLLQGEVFDKKYSVGELMHHADKSAIFFVDPHKNQTKYWVHMVDVHDFGALPLQTSKSCWWCRHPFQTQPIGIPIEYCRHEPDGPKKAARDAALAKSNLTSETNDFLTTIGVTCSFPCAMAYIKGSGESKFRDSETLLALLFVMLTGNVPTAIPPAGDWTLIKPNGHLSIEEFRQTFAKLDFFATPNIRRPLMYSCATVTQETVVDKT